MLHRAFGRMQARRWFTFFWVPLIPLKILGEFIECQSCKSSYDPAVLDMPTTAKVESQLNRALRHAVVAMLHADGTVDDRERSAAVAVVAEFGEEGYDQAALDQDLATLQVSDLEHELVEAGAMLSSQGQERVLQACLTLAMADGHLDPAEVKAIERAGRSLGMSAAHVKGVLAGATSEVEGHGLDAEP